MSQLCLLLFKDVCLRCGEQILCQNTVSYADRGLKQFWQCLCVPNVKHIVYSDFCFIFVLFMSLIYRPFSIWVYTTGYTSLFDTANQTCTIQLVNMFDGLVLMIKENRCYSPLHKTSKECRKQSRSAHRRRHFSILYQYFNSTGGKNTEAFFSIPCC